MKKALLILLVFAVGLSVGWVVRGESPQKQHPAGTVDYTGEVMIKQGEAPSVRYRPYGVILDGNRLHSDYSVQVDPSKTTFIRFDGGRLQISCVPVTP
jgi:hypothetical protein